MNEMIDREIDPKNVGLLKDLWQLRQALDAYCLISANAEAINKMDVGKSFFGFVQMSCQRLIVLYICKIFEEEKCDSRGAVQYELDSIGGVSRAIGNARADLFDPNRIADFSRKYGVGSPDDGPTAISAVVKAFRQRNQDALSRFKKLRSRA